MFERAAIEPPFPFSPAIVEDFETWKRIGEHGSQFPCSEILDFHVLAPELPQKPCVCWKIGARHTFLERRHTATLWAVERLF